MLCINNYLVRTHLLVRTHYCYVYTLNERTHCLVNKHCLVHTHCLVCAHCLVRSHCPLCTHFHLSQEEE